MQPTTVIFMVFILSVLWGGFVALLIHSMTTDRRRLPEGAVETEADDD